MQLVTFYPCQEINLYTYTSIICPLQTGAMQLLRRVYLGVLGPGVPADGTRGRTRA